MQVDIDFFERVRLRCSLYKKLSEQILYKCNVFTLSELKLLVDAVEASYFITQSKSAELIGKLSDLTSSNNADNGLYFS